MGGEFKCLKKVVLTRSTEDIERDRRSFEKLGFEVIPFPLIKTEPLEFGPPVSNPHFILFQSAKAVDYFLLRASIPKETKIVAVGDKTRRRLEEKGYSVFLVPEESSAEGVVRAFPEGNGEVVLIPRSEQGREEAIVGLRRKGYEVVPLNVYRTIELKPEEDEIKAVLKEAGFIVFASPSAVRSFFANLQKDRKALWLKGIVVVAIGKTTKGELEKLGVVPNIVPVKPLMEEVAREIHSFWQENCNN